VRGGDLILQDLLQVVSTTNSSRTQEDALQAVFSITRKLYFKKPTHVPGSTVLAVVAKEHGLARMRLLALETLGYVAAPEAVEVLTTTLQNARQPLERRAAAKALGRYTHREIRLALEQALNDPSPDVRIEAMLSLGHREDVALSLAAIQAYSEAETWMLGKQAAYNTLALHGAENTRLFLEAEMLRAPQERNALMISEAFRRANRPFSLSVAVQILDNPEVPFLTKRHTIDSLGSAVKTPYFDALTERIQNPSLYPELDEKRRQTLLERSILALGRHRTPAAMSFLLGRLSDPTQQHVVLRALAFFNNPDLIPILREFQSQNPALESAIADTITMIERRQTVDEIQEGIEDVKDALDD
jgi:HEAT repeat protein